MTRLMRLALIALLAIVSPPLWAQPPSPAPNIVLLLIDDASLTDLGIYGGEANTPYIDALAAQGVMFTQYRSSPLCSPSRAMLLTGIDNHRTGIATIPEVLPKEHKGKPGYTMRLEPGVLTLATHLKSAGYRTLMTGKWHLGSGRGDLPDSHGFDRSFALDASGADNWEDKSYMPFYAKAPWYEDGKPAKLPDDFYSSEFLIDRLITYLKEGPSHTPFFAYVGFQAIHIPLQAPPEYTRKYLDTYSEGWEALHVQRWQQAQKIGLIPATAEAPKLHPDLRKWTDLSEDEQTLHAARMAVSAGMLEAMDHHIGRLISYLKQTGQYENTFFIITSDNGPEPSAVTDPRFAKWLARNGYHTGLDNIGEKGSYAYIGPEFASASGSPGHLFKFTVSEGGVRVPLIISGPGLSPAMTNARAFVTDITPTLLAITGAEPVTQDAVSMDGRSLLPILKDTSASVYEDEDVIGIEVSGNAALYRGAWKITRNLPPWGDRQWRLYNIETDPGETLDLSLSEPDLFADMLSAYQAYADRVGVIEVPADYDSVAQISRNVTAKVFQRNLPAIAAVSAVMTIVIAALTWLIIRNIRRQRMSP